MISYFSLQDERVYKCWDHATSLNDDSSSITVNRERNGEASNSGSAAGLAEQPGPDGGAGPVIANPKPKPRPKPIKEKTVPQQAKAVS